MRHLGTVILDCKLHDTSGNHLVQFYETDAFLIDGLTKYIGSALARGEKGLVIATRPHLDALERNLYACGTLPAPAENGSSLYLAAEATAMLPLFMINGSVDRQRLTDILGNLMRDTSDGHDGKVYIFSEIMAILCGEDYKSAEPDDPYGAAIHVEACFTSLLRQHDFSLLCGYPIAAFPRDEDASAFHLVCTMHSSVIPTESFDAAAGIDDLQRSVAKLQQKAFSLTNEVSQRLKIEQALHEVNFDRLTGLPNRSVFQDRLQMEILQAQRNGNLFALLFIDLDNFKEINDSLGHDAGDILLAQVGQRLAQSVRARDTVARLGGDEFTVILSDITGAADAGRIAENMLAQITAPFDLLPQIAYVSASVGITLYPADGETVADLLKNADQAMYAAKNLGRNQACYFTRSMQEAAQKRMRLTNELRNALPGRQLRLLYQPIVSLATGAIHKAEALLRWQHPQHGLVNPAEFIPIAEHTGMIVDIGEWVFYEATRHAQRWRRLDPQFQVSVNVSPAQFQKGLARQVHWIEFLQRFKHTSPGARKPIAIEITESLLLAATRAVTSQLLAFRDAGIQVSLDDFGTGYSSLSYLRKFDIDYLKIDRSFVNEIELKADNLALCEAIIVMAHKLGLTVIAEGVENCRQVQLLAAAGCDYGQGYLFSAPVTASALDLMLRTSTEHHT